MQQFNSDSQALALIPPGLIAHRLGRVWAGSTDTYWDHVFQQHHHESLVAQLKREGYEWLGTGAFSICLTHPDWPDRVLKIEVGEADDGNTSNAPKFWQLCLEYKLRGTPNVHMPEVYATGQLKRADDESANFVWMKRYEPGESSCRHQITYASNYGTLHDLPIHLADTVDVDQWDAVLEAASALGNDDLHSDNIMWDQDTQRWIITDPIF